jgi:hypothetical protein
MHVLVNHQISNPEAFWSLVKTQPEFPEGFKVDSLMAGTNPTEGVCLWTAPNVDSLRTMLDGMLIGLCTNTYMQIDEERSFGLPDQAAQQKDLAGSHH